MISYEELEEYLSRFSEDQKEIIYKEIVDSDLFENAFSTTEGRLILNSVVDVVRVNITKIIASCKNLPPEEFAKSVYPYCVEVHTAFKIIGQWADIYKKGKGHKEKIKQRSIK